MSEASLSLFDRNPPVLYRIEFETGSIFSFGGMISSFSSILSPLFIPWQQVQRVLG